MNFVETLDRSLAPVGKIGRLWSNEGAVWIQAANETRSIIGSLDQSRDAFEPVIPASPGWEVITPTEDEAGFLLSLLPEPVIGWRDCEHGPAPITAMQSEKNML